VGELLRHRSGMAGGRPIIHIFTSWAALRLSRVVGDGLYLRDDPHRAMTSCRLSDDLASASSRTIRVATQGAGCQNHSSICGFLSRETEGDKNGGASAPTVAITETDGVTVKGQAAARQWRAS